MAKENSYSLIQSKKIFDIFNLFQNFLANSLDRCNNIITSQRIGKIRITRNI